MAKYRITIELDLDFKPIFEEIEKGLFSEDEDEDEDEEGPDESYEKEMIFDSLKNSYMYALDKNMDDLVKDKEDGLYKYLRHHNKSLLQVSKQISDHKRITLEKIDS
jgi:hypothetical protein